MTHYRVNKAIGPHPGQSKKPDLLPLFNEIPEDTTYLDASNLGLWDCPLPTIIEAFAKIPDGVTEIDLGCNRLGFNPKVLAKILSLLSKKVVAVSLSYNQLEKSSKGLIAFPGHIRHLDLSENFYDTKDTETFIEVLKLVTPLLETLFILRNVFSHHPLFRLPLEDLKKICLTISDEVQLDLGSILITQHTNIVDLSEKIKCLPLGATKIKFDIDTDVLSIDNLALLMSALPNSVKELHWNRTDLSHNLSLLPKNISSLHIPVGKCPASEILSIATDTHNGIPEHVTVLRLDNLRSLEMPTDNSAPFGLPQIKTLTLTYYDIQCMAAHPPLERPLGSYFPNLQELIVLDTDHYGRPSTPKTLTQEEANLVRRAGFKTKMPSLISLCNNNIKIQHQTAPEPVDDNLYLNTLFETTDEPAEQENNAPVDSDTPTSSPSSNPPHSHANTLFILSGIFAAAGAVALIVALVALSAATGGVAGMVVAALGLGALLASGGLFAAGMRNPEANPHYAPAMQV